MSDSFDESWLSLRAAADVRARDPGLAARLGERLASRATGGPLRVLDLGAGAGNNLRALAPLLAPLGPQVWTLVDSDAALLAHAAAHPPALADGTLTIETRQADLAEGIAPLLDPLPDLATASALFDLAGRAWLEGLADTLAAARLPLYALLSYDGRQHWAPPHEADAAVIAAFHADQARDKGLGPALGPEAHATLAALLATRGFDTAEAASDWVLEAPRDAALIAALAEGTAAAARPAEPAAA
ncbi:MAG: hypothetical protein AAFV86_11385, partial [Pseudomonadota bacterium]